MMVRFKKRCEHVNFYTFGPFSRLRFLWEKWRGRVGQGDMVCRCGRASQMLQCSCGRTVIVGFAV